METLPVKIRCDCGALFDDARRYCPECGQPRGFVVREIEQLAALSGRSVDELYADDRAGRPLPELPATLRARKLDEAVRRFSGEGFEIVSRSETSAQLRRKKRFDWLIALALLVFTIALGFILYALYVLFSSPELLYVSVDERGTVHVDREGNHEFRAIVNDLNRLPA